MTLPMILKTLLFAIASDQSDKAGIELVRQPDVIVAWNSQTRGIYRQDAIFWQAHKATGPTRMSGPCGFIGSLHIPLGARDCSPCDGQSREAKLLASRIPDFAVLLSKYFTDRITINKIAPVFRLGLFYLLGAFTPAVRLVVASINP